MLRAWGFDKVGVVAGDLYFVDPEPDPGQEGAEKGVRLEVRLLERPPVTGSIYASQPIVIDRPVWRADLFESVEGGVGTWDRTHHHPAMRGWEPGKRRFDTAMTTDPIAWLTGQLSDLPALVEQAELPAESVGSDDARHLAEAAPQIAAAVAEMLSKVRAGELGQPPAGAADGELESARSGWL